MGKKSNALKQLSDYSTTISESNSCDKILGVGVIFPAERDTTSILYCYAWPFKRRLKRLMEKNKNESEIPQDEKAGAAKTQNNKKHKKNGKEPNSSQSTHQSRRDRNIEERIKLTHLTTKTLREYFTEKCSDKYCLQDKYLYELVHSLSKIEFKSTQFTQQNLLNLMLPEPSEAAQVNMTFPHKIIADVVVSFVVDWLNEERNSDWKSSWIKFDSGDKPVFFKTFYVSSLTSKIENQTNLKKAEDIDRIVCLLKIDEEWKYCILRKKESFWSIFINNKDIEIREKIESKLIDLGLNLQLKFDNDEQISTSSLSTRVPPLYMDDSSYINWNHVTSFLLTKMCRKIYQNPTLLILDNHSKRFKLKGWKFSNEFPIEKYFDQDAYNDIHHYWKLSGHIVVEKQFLNGLYFWAVGIIVANTNFSLHIVFPDYKNIDGDYVWRDIRIAYDDKGIRYMNEMKSDHLSETIPVYILKYQLFQAVPKTNVNRQVANTIIAKMQKLCLFPIS